MVSPLLSEREIIIILGQSGQGKSTWTRHKVSDCERLCVWDPKRSYPVQYPVDLAGWWLDEGHRLPRFAVGAYIPEDAEAIGSIAFDAKICTLVLEECSLLFPNAQRPLADWAREVVYTGRGASGDEVERQVSVLAVAQRPSSIPVAIRSQATRVITFRQREARDLDWLVECFDSSDVLNLQKLECLEFDVNTSEVSRYSISHLLPHRAARPSTAEPEKQLEETLDKDEQDIVEAD